MMRVVNIDLPWPDYYHPVLEYRVPGESDGPWLHVKTVRLQKQCEAISYGDWSLYAEIWQGELDGVLYQAWRWYRVEHPPHLRLQKRLMGKEPA